SSSALFVFLGLGLVWPAYTSGQQVPRSGDLPDEATVFRTFRQAVLRYPFTRHVRIFNIESPERRPLTDVDLRQLAEPLARIRVEFERANDRFSEDIRKYVGISPRRKLQSHLSLLNYGSSIAQATANGVMQIDARVLAELVRAELSEVSTEHPSTGIEL